MPGKQAFQWDGEMPLIGPDAVVVAVSARGGDCPAEADEGKLRASISGVERDGDDVILEIEDLPEGRPLAGAVASLRRRVTRLARGTATGRIEDEVALLGNLERRIATAPWVPPETRARLAPLRRMRDCLGDLRALAERLAAIETETLCRFHLRDVTPPEAS